MPNIDKVVKGLECCTRESDSINENPCFDCPYADCVIFHNCADKLKRDALDLLKRKKATFVPAVINEKWNGEKCSQCGSEYIGSAPHKWRFCPDCGAKMEGR